MRKLSLFLLLSIAFQSMAQLKFIPSGVFHWAEIPVTKGELREGRKFMEGSSTQFSFLEIHASTQQKGAVMRPPHAQKDLEEVLLVKEGTMKFTIDNKSRVLGKGSFILVPPLAMQSVENVGDGPLSYYVIMFRSNKPMDMDRSAKAGGAMLLNADSLKYVPSARGGGIKYLDRPTAMCENFEMHVTQLDRKGPSHVPHSHVDTEVIIMIEGESDMIIGDKTYKASAGDLYLMNSNELHGISNIQDKPCKYFAIRWK